MAINAQQAVLCCDNLSLWANYVPLLLLLLSFLQPDFLLVCIAVPYIYTFFTLVPEWKEMHVSVEAWHGWLA